METATHYATLGVTQSAELPVIRAAYKALALNHHPDKTVHLSAVERAQHSSTFRNIQDAWDVLGNPSSKVAYDRELARHGNRVDVHRSTFHRPPTPPRRRNTTIRLTSPQEKRALKAKVEQDLAYLREQRAKRDIDDANMDVPGLTFMLHTWTQMAQEYADDALSDGSMRAHCAVQIQVYQAKIARREREHEEWLEGMSRPKTLGAKPTASSRPATSSSGRRRTAAPASKFVPRAPTAAATAKQAHLDAKAATVRADRENKAKLKEVERQESERIACRRAEASARKDAAMHAHLNAKSTFVRADTEHKANLKEQQRQESERLARRHAEATARKEAARQAHLNAKAAAVRADKERHNAKLAELQRLESERLARGRAKAGYPPRRAGRNAFHNESSRQECSTASKPALKKVCSHCDTVHASFAEWRKCHLESAKQEGDEAFFRTV